MSRTSSSRSYIFPTLVRSPSVDSLRSNQSPLVEVAPRPVLPKSFRIHYTDGRPEKLITLKRDRYYALSIGDDREGREVFHIFDGGSGMKLEPESAEHRYYTAYLRKLAVAMERTTEEENATEQGGMRDSTRSAERKRAFYDALHGDVEGIDRMKEEVEMGDDDESVEAVEGEEEDDGEDEQKDEEKNHSTATPFLPLTGHFSVKADDPSQALPALEDDAEEPLDSAADDSGVFLPDLSAFVDGKDDEGDDQPEELQLPPFVDSVVIGTEEKPSPIGALSDLVEDDSTLAGKAPVTGRDGSGNGEKKRSREEEDGVEEKKQENGGEKKKKKKNKQHKKSKKAKKEKGGMV
jgi:hypothetical protein